MLIISYVNIIIIINIILNFLTNNNLISEFTNFHKSYVLFKIYS